MNEKKCSKKHLSGKKVADIANNIVVTRLARFIRANNPVICAQAHRLRLSPAEAAVPEHECLPRTCIPNRVPEPPLSYVRVWPKTLKDA